MYDINCLYTLIVSCPVWPQVTVGHWRLSILPRGQLDYSYLSEECDHLHAHYSNLKDLWWFYTSYSIQLQHHSVWKQLNGLKDLS